MANTEVPTSIGVINKRTESEYSLDLDDHDHEGNDNHDQDHDDDDDDTKSVGKTLSVQSSDLSYGDSSVSGDKSSELARAESRWVLRSKVLVYLSLVIAAATCGTAANYLLRQQEHKEFEKQV